MEAPSPLASGGSALRQSPPTPQQQPQSATAAAADLVIPSAFWFSVGAECDQLVSSQVWGTSMNHGPPGVCVGGEGYLWGGV